MGTARQTVQQADAKRGVCMPLMCFGFLMSNSAAMSVEVKMAITLMFVFVGVDSQSFAQRPQTNPKEHHAHHSLAPG